MDPITESQIVSLWIEPSRRERTCFELSKPAKREACIWRLESRLTEALARPIQAGIANGEELIAILRREGAKGKCYALSVDSAVDGQWWTMEEAITKTVFYGPALLWFPDANIAYFEGEGGVCAPNRLILRSRK